MQMIFSHYLEFFLILLELPSALTKMVVWTSIIEILVEIIVEKKIIICVSKKFIGVFLTKVIQWKNCTISTDLI